MAVSLQEVIHRVEVGPGAQILKYLLALIIMVGAVVLYDATRFRNLDTVEGMDAAQLARNLAAGRGYTTQFVRPFSVHLVETHRPDHNPRLQTAHPDLANPPVYPALLAVALSLMPFDYPDLTVATSFGIYLPDLWIALFNQALFLVAAWLVFLVAKRLFDEPLAWLSAIVFLGAEALWRFSVSGQSTLLLLVIFLAITDVVSRLEAGAREAYPQFKRLFLWAAVAGVLAGLGCLTRYAFGWLMLPLGIWIASFGGSKRTLLACVTVGAFAVVVVPWLTRNWMISGVPFGTAGYAIYQGTPFFPGDQLERTLHPSFSGLDVGTLVRKFFANAKTIVGQELPRLGGSWVIALFAVGLLVPFRKLALRRLRYWLLGCLGVLFVAQALGRTELSVASPQINSENLLVLTLPLLVIFGTSLYATLSSQIAVMGINGRYWLHAVFLFLASAPLVSVLLAPGQSPVAYPPYYPPWIMAKCRHVGPQDLVMSDVPWAVAWYGNRQSIWLTLKHQGGAADELRDDFYGVASRKPVSALYLTAKTLQTIESSVIWQPATGPEGMGDWRRFVLGTYVNGEVPTEFPLRLAPEGLGPEIFLTDSER